MESTFKDLAEAIQKIREERNLTQKDLAKISGVSYSTITKIESRVITKPRVFIVAKLCLALDITVDDLLKLIPNYDD